MAGAAAARPVDRHAWRLKQAYFAPCVKRKLFQSLETKALPAVGRLPYAPQTTRHAQTHTPLISQSHSHRLTRSTRSRQTSIIDSYKHKAVSRFSSPPGAPHVRGRVRWGAGRRDATRPLALSSSCSWLVRLSAVATGVVWPVWCASLSALRPRATRVPHPRRRRRPFRRRVKLKETLNHRLACASSSSLRSCPRAASTHTESGSPESAHSPVGATSCGSPAIPAGPCSSNVRVR